MQPSLLPKNMACFGKGLSPQAGSAFKADALGNQLVKMQPKRPLGVPINAAACCTPACSAYAFEQLTVPGFLAATPTAQYLPIRIVDAVQTIHGLVSVGSAISTSSWDVEGFVLLGTEQTCARSASLSAATSIGACYLNKPTALVVDPTSGAVIVVGSGYIIDLTGTTSAQLPAVARVDPQTLAVFVQVGNGGTLANEQYTDVVVDAACSPAPGFIVCGVAGSPLTAVVRKLAQETLLPVPIATTGLPYTLLTNAALYAPYTFVTSRAVSLAASGPLGTIVVGVHATILNSVLSIASSSSLLWSLRLDGTPLYPLSVTSYNSMLTCFLPTPANVDRLTLVAVRIAAGGTTYAVSAGRTTSGAAMPPTVTVVHAFDADTLPILSFGTSGIVTWFDVDSLSSFPVSATLAGFDGALLVVGNSFNPTAAPPPGSTAIYPIQQPYLEVDVPLSSSGGYSIGAATTPFLLRLNCAGCAAQLLRALPCNPCSTFLWAAVLVFTAPQQAMLVGDCATKPLAPAQPSLVLTMALHVSGSASAVRYLNATRQEQAMVDTSSCDGVVAVDTHCAPTVMVVNGPVVVGDSSGAEPALPGAIRFREGRFSGYNGTSWVFLDSA